MQAFGLELTGYDFELTFNPMEAEPPVVFSSAPPGGAANFASFPGDYARIHVVDHPSGEGVIVVGYDGFTPEARDQAAPLFEEVLPTLMFAG